MKKGISILFALILILNLVYAVDIDVKGSYNPGDTMQVEIPDVFLENLKLSNVGIYEEFGVHPTPVESGLIKSSDTYFYYAILPQKPGKYSFKIEDSKVKSYANSELQVLGESFPYTSEQGIEIEQSEDQENDTIIIFTKTKTKITKI